MFSKLLIFDLVLLSSNAFLKAYVLNYLPLDFFLGKVFKIFLFHTYL